MTEIKICGLKYEADVEAVNKAMPEYVGFVLYEKSKRFVSVERATELMKLLDPAIKTVAVTVSPSAELIDEIQKAPFSILQVHGSFDEKAASYVKLPLWQALNLTQETQIRELLDQAQAIVLDGATYGGGKTFDWDNVSHIREKIGDRKLVLAGGLHSGNIEDGIKRFAPDVVDVSSGVEGAQGKDKTLVATFVGKVRAYNE